MEQGILGEIVDFGPRVGNTYKMSLEHIRVAESKEELKTQNKTKNLH